MFFRAFNPKALRVSRMVEVLTAARPSTIGQLQFRGIIASHRCAVTSSMSISQMRTQYRLASTSKGRVKSVKTGQKESEMADDDNDDDDGIMATQRHRKNPRKGKNNTNDDDDDDDGEIVQERNVDWERNGLMDAENAADVGEQEGGDEEQIESEEEWLRATDRRKAAEARGSEELDDDDEDVDEDLTSARNRKGKNDVDEDEDETGEEDDDGNALKEVHVDERLLSERFPEYAEEYDSSNEIPVDKILFDSAKVALWNCSECLTQWPCAVFVRCTLRTKCPTCTDSKSASLGMYPGIIDRWDQARNDPLVDPTKLHANSKTKAYWLCAVCNNSFKESASTAVAKRVVCPQCRLSRTAHHSLSREFLMREWHPLKNGDLDPNSVQDTDKTKVWWLCSGCGEEWSATFYNRRSARRMNKGKYCPACRNLALLET